MIPAPRRRASDRPSRSDRWFKLMAFLGAGTWTVVIVLEVTVAALNAFTTRTYRFEVPHIAIYLASALGFVGFYGLNPRRARDGGEFLLGAVERVVAVVRGGRRKTDVLVVTPPPDVPVVVTPPEENP